MKLIKRVFFDTEQNDTGHFSVYEKRNGNTYITFFIEERYKAFREYSRDIILIDGNKHLDFKMLNKVEYDRSNRRI
tara:strand:- start:228 stop:455 length:228 start_codon:yes stop_codon:yes gene_type:complete